MVDRMRRWAAIGFVLMLVGAACGSDDGGGGDVAAFCSLSAEFEEQSEFPSAEQLDEVVDAAPGEIRDDVETLADAFRSIEDDPEVAAEVFEDEEVLEAGERVEQFEEENCDGGDS